MTELPFASICSRYSGQTGRVVGQEKWLAHVWPGIESCVGCVGSAAFMAAVTFLRGYPASSFKIAYKAMVPLER